MEAITFLLLENKNRLGGKELPKHELIGLAYEMDADAFSDLPNDGNQYD